MSLPSIKSLGFHSLPSLSRFLDPSLSLCLTPFSGFLSGSGWSLFISPLGVHLALGFCVSRFWRGSPASPPLQINKPSPPPPLSQGGGAGMWGSRILSHPTPASETQGLHGRAECRGSVSPRGAGVSVHTSRPASVPATHPPPAWRADPMLRTRGRASPAGASGGRPRERALEGRRMGSGVFTSLLHFLSSAFPRLGVGTRI